jgi:hypothetical protein
MAPHRPVTRVPYDPDAIDIGAILRAENAERFAKVQAEQYVPNPQEQRVLRGLAILMVVVVLVAWSWWGR